MATYLYLRRDCELTSIEDGSGGIVANTPSGEMYRISRMGCAFLNEIKEGRSLEEISERLASEQTSFTADEIASHLLTSYATLLAVQGTPEATPRLRQRPFLVDVTLFKKETVCRLAAPLTCLFSSTACLFLVSLICLSHLLVYRFWSQQPHGSSSNGTALALILCIISVVAHELGHAAALSHFGGSPGRIGFGFYLLAPVFYADVSPAWRLPVRARLIVDLAGVYFQQAIFAIYAVFAWRFHFEILRSVCIGIDLMTFVALNPAFRFDGYWFLADWLGVSNLRAATVRFLRGMVTILFRHPESTRTVLFPSSLGRVKISIFACYSLFAYLFTGLAILANLQSIRASVVHAYRGVPVFGQEFLFACRATDWWTAINLALTMWFLASFAAMPLVGIALKGNRWIKNVPNLRGLWSREEKSI